MAWKAARRDYRNAQRRLWLTSMILGPLSFSGLALLAGSPCPQPMDFVALAGVSLALLVLWFWAAERCLAARDLAAQELLSAESDAGQRSIIPTPGSGSPDRAVRLVLALLLAVLWAWTYAIRPDCTIPEDDEGDLAAYAVPFNR